MANLNAGYRKNDASIAMGLRFGKQVAAFVRNCGIKEKMGPLVFLLLWGNGQASADAAAPGEYAVKAAFIHHFAQFVAWPSDGPASLERIPLCILGADPFGNALDVIRGKRIDTQTWEIRLVGTAVEARDCSQLLKLARIVRSEGDSDDR